MSNRHYRLWLAICLALLALAASTRASAPREYYLDSRSGSDETPGTRERPWRSLDRLAKVAFHPGDTVYFTCGSHFEGGFEVNQSGTATAPITFKTCGDGPAPRFRNPQPVILDGNAIRLNASHIIVEGLFFERCPANPVSADVRTLGAVFLTTNANYDIVRNCEMTETPIGVNVYGQHNLVTRNYIFVYDASRVEPMFARGEVDHSYNLFYRTDQASIPKQANREAYEHKYLGGGAQLREGDRIGDPLFRDLAGGDFRLKPGSPAIDAGTNLQYTLDFDDHPIPAGDKPDLGAFEFRPDAW